jgi:hypothetical protein
VSGNLGKRPEAGFKTHSDECLLPSRLQTLKIPFCRVLFFRYYRVVEPVAAKTNVTLYTGVAQ